MFAVRRVRLLRVIHARLKPERTVVAKNQSQVLPRNNMDLVAEGMRVHVVDALLQGDDVEFSRCRSLVLWARWKRDELETCQEFSAMISAKHGTWDDPSPN